MPNGALLLLVFNYLLLFLTTHPTSHVMLFPLLFILHEKLPFSVPCVGVFFLPVSSRFEECVLTSLGQFKEEEGTLFDGHGKAELKSVPSELLHNEREREAEEESTGSEPGESSPFVGAQTETLQGQQQQQLQGQEFSSQHT
ncbi:hypothetical protein V6N13_035185 [Hibiscus sabdariffa]